MVCFCKLLILCFCICAFLSSYVCVCICMKSRVRAEAFVMKLTQNYSLKTTSTSKIKELQSSSNVADGKWHKLTIRPSSYQRLNVSLDDASTTPSVIFDLGTTHVDLSNNLFVGGIPASKSASSTDLSSHKGFTGCLASVTVNGRLYDLMRDAIVPSTYVTAGCTGEPGCFACFEAVE